MNRQKAILNRMQWMQEMYGLGREDAVLQKTPFTFDVSVWEFFWPLLQGSRLVMARPGGHKDSAYLVKTIEEEGITTVHFVPTMLRVFLEEAGGPGCRSLKRVICSGEALSAEIVERYFESMESELHNLYGPTEAAVDVTYWECERGKQDEKKQKRIPIGRPIANTGMYVLDRAMTPVPVGVTGELYIGGAGVGRGYLGQGGWTAERFVPDGYGGGKGERLYRSGDLARWRADGVMEYVGRRDEQVKVRGYRIELGEIEAVLRENEGVGEAVVVVRENGKGEKRLVGYVEKRKGWELEGEELREYVQGRLPEYMVPGQYVVVEQLGLTENGKIDRKGLPEVEEGEEGAERPDAANGDRRSAGQNLVRSAGSERSRDTGELF